MIKLLRSIISIARSKKNIIIVTFVVIGFGSFVSFFMLAGEYKKQEDLGPAQFNELLKLAKQSKPNDDPYISSEYKPTDHLFKAMLAVQTNTASLDLLEELVEQGNVDAMFWLAKEYYPLSSSYFYKAESLFREAADKGNPYAAMQLDPRLYKGTTCDEERKPSMNCSEEWGDKALKILKQRADDGDIKAEYYYYKSYMAIKNDFEKKREYYLALVDIAVRGAKNKYYRPLDDLLSKYFWPRYESLYEQQGIKSYRVAVDLNDLDGFNDIKSLYMMMLDNNYPPALNFLFNRSVYLTLNDDQKRYVSEKNRMIISRSSLQSLFHRVDDESNISPIEKQEVLYVYGYLINHIFGDNTYLNFANDDFKLAREDPLQMLYKKKAKEVEKGISFPIYIDEMNWK